MNRGEDRKSGRLEPVWMWEEVRLHNIPNEGVEDGRLVFEGKIRNLFGDEFRCQARLVGNTLFYVRGWQLDRNAQRKSVQEFVSVFTWCQRSESDGYIYGHWAGTEPLDKSPAVYSTIWSWKPLSLDQLRLIAYQVRIRTLLNADEGRDFARQPAVRTMSVHDITANSKQNKPKRASS